MEVRFFIEAKDEKEAIRITELGIDSAKAYIESVELKNVEKYWKMEEVHVIEMVIEVREKSMQGFLDVFSDDWLSLGKPTDELLASQNNERCTYMREGFILINIRL